MTRCILQYGVRNYTRLIPRGVDSLGYNISRPIVVTTVLATAYHPSDFPLADQNRPFEVGVRNVGNMNKHGLSRTIPSDIKREVRQRCGFGCVVCGLGIIQYEHVDPEFHNAHQHEADNIALLCPQCHAKVTTGFWSKYKVKQGMADPICKRQGYTKEVFDFCGGHPILQFGGVSLSNCPIPIEVRGLPLFKIEKPEIEGGPFRLSGLFCDVNGQVTLQIDENEWIASSDNWDVEVSGGVIVIREASRKIHLRLKVEPPSKLIVDRLDMHLGSFGFEANGEVLKIKAPNGDILSEITGCVADNCRVGLSFN